MSIIELIILALGLSTDCFTVSICKGLTFKNNFIEKSLKLSICFVLFHTLIPIIGYTIGTNFEDKIGSIDHWIGFMVFSIMGVKMIFDAYMKESNVKDTLKLKEMLILGFATSIDAFVVGITFGILNVNIYVSMLVISIIVFIMCILGTIIGKTFGRKYETKSKIIGGAILILLGIKMLIEHLL